MDTLRRRRWIAEINNESAKSTSTLQRRAKPTLDEESPEPISSTAIVRVEGYINIMASPLLLEALHRLDHGFLFLYDLLDVITVLSESQLF